MNREKVIRLYIHGLLNGTLAYNATTIPVWDSKLEDKTNIYVIIEEQSANVIQKFPQQMAWECSINLFIVSKQQDTVSRDVVDDIAEQIETIVYNALQNGVVTNGWQLNNMALASTEHSMFELLHSKMQVSKTMTFRLEANKTTSY